MDWTIHFNDQPKSRRVKVNNKIPDRLLTPELYAVQLLSTQRFPEDFLSFRWLLTKLPRTLDHLATDLVRNNNAWKLIFHIISYLPSPVVRERPGVGKC